MRHGECNTSKSLLFSRESQEPAATLHEIKNLAWPI